STRTPTTHRRCGCTRRPGTCSAAPSPRSCTDDCTESPAASPGGAAPQPVEGAPILLGGTSHALVAAGYRSTQRRVRGRRAVLVAPLRDRGAGARGEDRADDEDALAARGPDPDRLARA